MCGGGRGQKLLCDYNHRTGPGATADPNSGHRLRCHWEEGAALLPQQGHFQGLSKAWEGGRDPTLPTVLVGSELPAKRADMPARRPKPGDPSTHSPQWQDLHHWSLTLRSVKSNYCPVWGLGEGCHRDLATRGASIREGCLWELGSDSWPGVGAT